MAENANTVLRIVEIAHACVVMGQRVARLYPVDEDVSQPPVCLCIHGSAAEHLFNRGHLCFCWHGDVMDEIAAAQSLQSGVGTVKSPMDVFASSVVEGMEIFVKMKPTESMYRDLIKARAVNRIRPCFCCWRCSGLVCWS